MTDIVLHKHEKTTIIKENMKCPHCNLEHPDDFLFCPVTGKKLEQLKACSNPDCPDFGKYILPLESRFCPSCGSELPESQINPPRDSHSELFDLTLLSAGDSKLQVTKAIKDIFNFDLSKIVRIVNYAPCLIASGIPKEKAERYKKAIESFGATIEITRRVIANNSQSMSNKQSVPEELPSCPECCSDDVTDDGTGCMQYECNECGHMWGSRHDVECPECGSTDIIDDGTGVFQFKCKDCGHIWGEEKNENYEVEDDELHNLFPVAGIVLGETTINEVLERQYLYDKIVYSDCNDAPSDSYNKDGTTTVYYNDALFTKAKGDSCFTAIFMVKNMLPEWEPLGFDMSNSYDQWMNIFLKRKYKICIDEHPHREYDVILGYWYFKATFRAYSINESIMFKLEFSNKKGECKKSTRNTLLCITVFSSNSSRWIIYS